MVGAENAARKDERSHTDIFVVAQPAKCPGDKMGAEAVPYDVKMQWLMSLYHRPQFPSET